MKLEQRVAATIVSMCPYGTALMTRVSTAGLSTLTSPVFSLSINLFYLVLSIVGPGVLKDEWPSEGPRTPGICMHIVCVCAFLFIC